MGFSQADWEELQRLQGKFGKIRFGPRAVHPPPIHLSFLPPPAAPSRPRPTEKRPRKPPEAPGYEQHQLRLW